MSELITRTARLIPYSKRPKQVAGFVTAYSYEPLPDEPGAHLGNLYVVMEALVSGRASEELVDLIIETAGDHYYNQAHEEDILPRFESAIKAVNHELREHVNRGSAAWIGKLSAVLAIQSGSELHVAQTGSAEAILYRGKSAANITSSNSARPATPTKTFGSIASGRLEIGDRLLLATPALVHQLSLEKLKSIMTESSPNIATSEITQLLRGAAIDRIACLVIELTTPELAAMQVRSDQPNEIELGTPENAMEAAKFAAAPIAQTTVNSSKKIAGAAGAKWRKAKPKAQVIALALADKLRNLLSTRKGRIMAASSCAVAACAIAAIAVAGNTSASANRTFEQYQAVYQSFTHGQELLGSGNKTEAERVIKDTQDRLSSLEAHKKLINKKLASASKLAAPEPRTFQEFKNLINDHLDQISGLIKTDASTVVSLTTKTTKPNHMEIRDGKAYIFDAGNNNSLVIVNLLTGKSETSSVDMAKLGDVVSTTISGTNDGIYLLTSKPSVWFYRFDTNTISEQTISFGQWPKSSAIGSYFSNLYLLSDSGIFRHVKTASGFSPKSSYITFNQDTKNTTALAVDGSVYVASAAGLQHYLLGVLKNTAEIPLALKDVKNLRSADNGNLIIGTDNKSNRIGIWKADASGLNFDKQISVKNTKALRDTAYDPKTKAIYSIADNRLVRLNTQP